MRNVLALVLLSCLSVSSNAGYVGNQDPIKIFGASQIKFGVVSPPGDTCSFYKRHFKFDATTEGGKNILAILLAAKMAGKKVNIWYTASSSPGTDETNGCGTNSLAVINEIGVE